MTASPVSRVPAIEALPASIVNVADHMAHARTKLDDQAWAYFSGGAGDEITLRANSDAWDRIEIVPRVMRKLSGGNTRTALLGKTLAHPILLAPVAFQRLAHPDGELASAYAAAVNGAGLVLSTQSSVALESVAAAFKSEPSAGPLWFQLYLQHDRAFTAELVRRAEAAGYEALVLTVDAASSGVRDSERRSQFKLPPHISAVNLQGLPAWDMAPLRAGESAMFDRLLTHAPAWNDIAWLKSISKLPVIIKGIMHADDAALAIEHGADGLVVSNHGGRTLDTVPATATVLPQVAEKVAGRIPILVDGGIRRGTDVLKAIALGASAVMIGRPYVCALANAGAIGVAHVLKLLCDELEIAMALSGVATLAEAPSVLANSPARQS